MSPGLAAIVVCIGAVFSPALHAQTDAQRYPTRPVRWIVPFAPSGPTDIMSRAVAEKLSQRLGQPFVVDNRAGAGGNIGAEVVSKAAPDGYTLMIGHVGTHAINSALYTKLAFDPVRDFTPITLIATLPLALVVHAGVPVKNAKELIAYAKARPGQLNFASAGNGGPTHLTGELFKSSAGIEIVHVPYKGNAAALTDLVAGRMQMMFSNMLTSMPHVRAGKLRAIGISSPKRSPQAPDLPTIAESGVPGFSAVPVVRRARPRCPAAADRLEAQLRNRPRTDPARHARALRGPRHRLAVEHTRAVRGADQDRAREVAQSRARSRRQSGLRSRR